MEGGELRDEYHVVCGRLNLQEVLCRQCLRTLCIERYPPRMRLSKAHRGLGERNIAGVLALDVRRHVFDGNAWHKESQNVERQVHVASDVVEMRSRQWSEAPVGWLLISLVGNRQLESGCDVSKGS